MEGRRKQQQHLNQAEYAYFYREGSIFNARYTFHPCSDFHEKEEKIARGRM